MKRVKIFCALLLVTVFFLGCGEQSVPTDMSADGTGSLYKGKPIVIEDIPFGPFEFGVNPCTGLLHDHFGTFDIRIHEFNLNEDGDHHFNVFFKFNVETSDGYSGFVVQDNVDNGTGFPGSPDEEFSFSSFFNLNLSNEHGQRIKAHFNFHITIRDGEVLGFVLNDDGASCVGVPVTDGK